MHIVDHADANPLDCSPETPWGFHLPVTENVCPRCGWVARGEAGEEASASASG